MTEPNPAATEVVAAGGVLWRPDAGGRPTIAVVHRPRYQDWSLPKGKLDRRESVSEAAVRELAEETGFRAQLGHRLGEVRYRVPEGPKVVYWWAARAVSGAFVPGDEVDELRWLAPGAAAALLTYGHDREVLARFLRREPPPSLLLLVRHAKAGDRSNWSGADSLRQLTANGRKQAGRLATLLGLFGPSRVYSAPALRCRQTVGPLAGSLGLESRIEPLLGEVAYGENPRDGLARLLELAREPGVSVVCSQGAVIPAVVASLTGASEVRSPKASTWVLGFDGDRVVTEDYYPPPG